MKQCSEQGFVEGGKRMITSNKVQKRIVIMTLISGVLLTALPIAASLSPLANLGGNANQFGDVGMWVAVGICFLFYLIPLSVYMLGVEKMRIILAVLCFLGLFTSISAIGIIFLIGTFMDDRASLLIVLAIYAAHVIINIAWFVVAFFPRKNGEAY